MNLKIKAILADTILRGDVSGSARKVEQPLDEMSTTASARMIYCEIGLGLAHWYRPG